MPEHSVHPITFKDFEIHVTAVLTIKGSDYFASDWEHDEEAFRREMAKEATAGIRSVDLNLGDCWLDHIEEVSDVSA